MVKILVLGGTEFVGAAIVDDAVERGWQVTTVNRGTHPSHPGATALVGDRRAEGGLAAIVSGTWDLVVDTWSSEPSVVRDSADLLAGRAGHYSYISSRSVYAFPVPAGADESASVVEGSPDASTDDDYARSKRGGELAALSAFGDRSLCLRAGLILGPRENIGRLPWWLGRMVRGGDVLCPGPADAGIQFVDARDLAHFTLSSAVEGRGGVVDVVSRREAVTMRDLLHECRHVTESDAELRWHEPDDILAAGIEPWRELPVWLPPGPGHETMHESDVTRALTWGLNTRPVAETVADTWAWLQSNGGVAPQRPDRPVVGLSPEREAAFLEGRPVPTRS